MPVDELVHVRRFSARDIGRQVEDGFRGIGERGPFAGTHADAQGHLARPPEVTVA